VSPGIDMQEQDLGDLPTVFFLQISFNREVGRAKDLSAPQEVLGIRALFFETLSMSDQANIY
jgi:hypothetical protein